MGSLKEGRGQSEPTKVSRLRWSSRSLMKLKPAGDEAEEDDVDEAEPAGDEAEEKRPTRRTWKKLARVMADRLNQLMEAKTGRQRLAKTRAGVMQT
mgnify:CR=1 FL=1